MSKYFNIDPCSQKNVKNFESFWGEKKKKDKNKCPFFIFRMKNFFKKMRFFDLNHNALNQKKIILP